MYFSRFQRIDIILLKWDWQVKTQKSVFICVLRVLRDSDNIHAKTLHIQLALHSTISN